MRKIEYDKVVDAVAALCEQVAHELSGDVVDALNSAAGKETNPGAKRTLEQLIENARLASVERIPLCQDTGLAVLFVRQGKDVVVEAAGDKTIIDAINDGVARGYEQGYLRKSVVAEPMNERKNTGSNTPAVIHYEVIPGDKLEIDVMLKGGGCENKSQFRMFKPTADREEILSLIHI